MSKINRLYTFKVLIEDTEHHTGQALNARLTQIKERLKDSGEWMPTGMFIDVEFDSVIDQPSKD